MKKGLFITLEGTEGSGKSTQIAVIKAHMEAKGHKVVCLREPGVLLLLRRLELY